MSIEDKFFTIVNELVDNINEQFFLMDIDFDSNNCNVIFYEIAKMFLEKNRLDVLKKEALYFISDCFRKVNINGKNDYTLFFNNINILLELDFINMEDIEQLKNRISIKLGIDGEKKIINNSLDENSKILLLTNMG